MNDLFLPSEQFYFVVGLANIISGLSIVIYLLGWRRVIDNIIRLLLVTLFIGTARWFSLEWYDSGGFWDKFVWSVVTFLIAFKVLK